MPSYALLWPLAQWKIKWKLTFYDGILELCVRESLETAFHQRTLDITSNSLDSDYAERAFTQACFRLSLLEGRTILRREILSKQGQRHVLHDSRRNKMARRHSKPLLTWLKKCIKSYILALKGAGS